MDTAKAVTKAIAAGLVAGLTAAGTALTDGIISPLEWTIIAGATIVGTGIVYQVPNTPKSSGEHAAE